MNRENTMSCYQEDLSPPTAPGLTTAFELIDQNSKTCLSIFGGCQIAVPLPGEMLPIIMVSGHQFSCSPMAGLTVFALSCESGRCAVLTTCLVSDATGPEGLPTACRYTCYCEYSLAHISYCDSPVTHVLVKVSSNPMIGQDSTICEITY